MAVGMCAEMRKLTDIELREPDVIWTIPFGTRMPIDVWNDLGRYGGMSTEHGYTVRVPAYFARECEERIAKWRISEGLAIPPEWEKYRGQNAK